MKSKILTITILAATLLACGSKAREEKNDSRLTGTVNNVKTGKIYLQKFNNKMYSTIDSVDIVDGNFEFLTSNLQLPELYALSLNPENGQYLTFLEEGRLTVLIDSSAYYKNSQLQGSKLQDSFVAYQQLDDDSLDISEYIQANPSSLVSAYVLYRNFSYRLTPEEIGQNIALLDSTLYNTPYVKVLNEVKLKKEAVVVGKKAPNFTAPTPEGTLVSLSDIVNKHSYTLVDFWASWCGPCRRENPNVVAAYNKYKREGFTVLGVSLDKNKDKWEAGIVKDNLNWTQVSDLKFWDSEPAKLYGVRAIPSNFLVDKDGVIVAKDIKGDVLEQTLSKLYKR